MRLQRLPPLPAMWAVRFNLAVAGFRGRIVKMVETVKERRIKG